MKTRIIAINLALTIFITTIFSAYFCVPVHAENILHDIWTQIDDTLWVGLDSLFADAGTGIHSDSFPSDPNLSYKENTQNYLNSVYGKYKDPVTGMYDLSSMKKDGVNPVDVDPDSGNVYINQEFNTVFNQMEQDYVHRMDGYYLLEGNRSYANIMTSIANIQNLSRPFNLSASLAPPFDINGNYFYSNGGFFPLPSGCSVAYISSPYIYVPGSGSLGYVYPYLKIDDSSNLYYIYNWGKTGSTSAQFFLSQFNDVFNAYNSKSSVIGYHGSPFMLFYTKAAYDNYTNQGRQYYSPVINIPKGGITITPDMLNGKSLSDIFYVPPVDKSGLTEEQLQAALNEAAQKIIDGLSSGSGGSGGSTPTPTPGGGGSGTVTPTPTPGGGGGSGSGGSGGSAPDLSFINDTLKSLSDETVLFHSDTLKLFDDLFEKLNSSNEILELLYGESVLIHDDILTSFSSVTDKLDSIGITLNTLYEKLCSTHNLLEMIFDLLQDQYTDLTAYMKDTSIKDNVEMILLRIKNLDEDFTTYMKKLTDDSLLQLIASRLSNLDKDFTSYLGGEVPLPARLENILKAITDQTAELVTYGKELLAKLDNFMALIIALDAPSLWDSIMGFIGDRLSDLGHLLDLIFGNLISDLLSDLLHGLLGDFTDLTDQLTDKAVALASDFSTKFPMCIPWDLVLLVTSFSAEPKVPKFDIPINIPSANINETIAIDFSQYEDIASAGRKFFMILFLLTLTILSRKMYGVLMSFKEG
ncbi:MAG: hypothetical protein PHG16_07045 [Lachnospiraceae bacterium]|nr:hypothetical protein [Lachnospiraceae bacterium]